MIEVSVILKISHKEIKLTLDGAQEVYQQLNKLFETEKPIINPIYPNLVYPYQPIYYVDKWLYL